MLFKCESSGRLLAHNHLPFLEFPIVTSLVTAGTAASVDMPMIVAADVSAAAATARGPAVLAALDVGLQAGKTRSHLAEPRTDLLVNSDHHDLSIA